MSKGDHMTWLAALALLTLAALIDARTLRTSMGKPVPAAALPHYRRARTIAWVVGAIIAWTIFIFGNPA